MDEQTGDRNLDIHTDGQTNRWIDTTTQMTW